MQMTRFFGDVWFPWFNTQPECCSSSMCHERKVGLHWGYSSIRWPRYPLFSSFKRSWITSNRKYAVLKTHICSKTDSYIHCVDVIVHDPGIHYFDDLPFPADPFLPAQKPFFGRCLKHGNSRTLRKHGVPTAQFGIADLCGPWGLKRWDLTLQTGSDQIRRVEGWLDVFMRSSHSTNFPWKGTIFSMNVPSHWNMVMTFASFQTVWLWKNCGCGNLSQTLLAK